MKKYLFILIFAVLLFGFALAERPIFTGEASVVINDNIPDFTPGDDPIVIFSPLDDLGRAGTAFACLGPEMPAEPRSTIQAIIPAGFQATTYSFIPGAYLYNRSHLIAHQFLPSGDIAENLITGTQFLNHGVMLAIENTIAAYIQRTAHRVLYRVTPDYEGAELVPRGVQIEAQSIEDAEICLNVYCFNVQPGVAIDYRNGLSRIAETAAVIEQNTIARVIPADTLYILNTNRKRFHLPDCPSCADIKPKNRAEYIGTRDDLIAAGYTPCGSCKP